MTIVQKRVLCEATLTLDIWDEAAFVYLDRQIKNNETGRLGLGKLWQEVRKRIIKVTRPSFSGGGGYHPTLKLSGILTFTFMVSLTHRMDNT